MFKIYAVGSTDVLTREIIRAVDQLLEGALPILPCNAGALSTHADGDLYICNPSLYAAVAAVADPGRIALLNLMPTSAFYLNVRQIPYGADIAIFNNKRGYCETLENLCRSRGLSDYYYTALPYAEMPRRELELRLSSAQYIIGVSDVLDDILTKPPYSGLLRGDVQLIGARRIVSVEAANRIVTQLNRMLLADCQWQLSQLAQAIEAQQQDNFLYMHYSEISETIDRSIARLRENTQRDEARENIVVRAAINQLNR